MKHVIIAAALAVILSSCSAQEAPTDRPELSPFLKSQFDMYLNTNLTEKQREILSDYWVTDEEWIDISSDFHACMEPTGIEGSLRDDQFGYGLSTAHQEKVDAELNRDSEKVFAQFDEDMKVVFECAYKTADPIGLLYFEARSNPDGLEVQQVILRCFQENGITDLDEIPESEILDYVFSEQYNYRTSPERIKCVENPSYGEFAEHNN